MLKKIILASAILAATASVAEASAAPAPYVGGSVGITDNTVTTSGTNAANGAYRGVPLSLFAGYGGVVNQNFYLAGELFGTVATANLTDKDVLGLKTSYTYGASIIPGVMVSNNTLAYARAGVLRSRFPKTSMNRTGGQVGLGMQTSLTQNLDLRGEYDFNAYQAKKQMVNGSRISVAPRADMFTVGLVYKFD